MASEKGSGKAALAQQAWKLFFDFLVLTSQHREQALASLDATPNDARALGTLDAVTGTKMSDLAKQWGTDASNTTWIVDRLEARGWVERRSAPNDRRVRLVVLTPLGSRTKNELLKLMYQPPPELLKLGAAELKALRDGLAILPRR